jgi:hypothetical protein
MRHSIIIHDDIRIEDLIEVLKKYDPRLPFYICVDGKEAEMSVIDFYDDRVVLKGEL